MHSSFTSAILEPTSQGGIDDESVVGRLNYGVVFRRRSSARISPTHWKQTVSVPLPSELPLAPTTDFCKTQMNHIKNMDYLCDGLRNQYEYLIHLHNKGITKYNAILLGIYNMFASDRVVTLGRQSMAFMDQPIARYTAPSPKVPTRPHLVTPNTNYSRNRRALPKPLFGPISTAMGRIGSAFFGLVTQEQLVPFGMGIVGNTIRLNHAQERIENVEHSMKSFMAVTQQQLELITNRTIANFRLISKLDQRLRKDEMLQVARSKLALIIHRQHEINRDLEKHVQRFSDGIEKIFNMQLSSNIIPRRHMKHIISNIQMSYSRAYPNSKLVVQDIHEIYSSSKFIWLLENYTLTIGIFIRLVVPESIKIFEIETFNVPIHGNQISRVNDLPQYIALGTTVGYHPTHNDVTSCQYKVVCPLEGMYFNIENDRDCATAIFFSDSARVKEVCGFSYSKFVSPPTSYIKLLKPGTFLISNIKSIELSCNHQLTRHKKGGCEFCVRSFPCGCTVYGGHYKLDAQAHDCPNIIPTDTEVLHPINLALLQYAGKEVSKIIKPGTLLAERHEMSSFFDMSKDLANLYHYIEKSSANSMDLKTVVESFQKGIKKYNMTQFPIDMPVRINPTTDSIQYYGTFALFLLVIFMLFIMFYLYTRINTVTQLVRVNNV